MELFTLYPQAFGLDISDLSIKIVQLKKYGNGLRLASRGEFPVPQGIIEQGEIKQKEEAVRVLKESLKRVEGQKLSRFAAVSLPEEKAFIQLIQLPRITEEEIGKAIQFEAENYIPLPLDSVYLDFQHAPPLANHLDHLDVLLASLPKATVDAYLEILLAAGIRPLAFEVESLSLSRALVEKETSPFPVLLLDLGATRTGLVVFSGRSPRLTVSLPVSSRRFSEAIAAALHIEKGTAESFKKKYGIAQSRNEEGQAVKEALLPLLQELAAHIQKYVDFYASHANHQHLPKHELHIKKIVLAGGGAALKGLPEFLAKHLKIQVAFGNPWVNIFHQPMREIPPLALQDSLEYATALGLALRVPYD